MTDPLITMFVQYWAALIGKSGMTWLWRAVLLLDSGLSNA